MQCWPIMNHCAKQNTLNKCTPTHRQLFRRNVYINALFFFSVCIHCCLAVTPPKKFWQPNENRPRLALSRNNSLRENPVSPFKEYHYRHMDMLRLSKATGIYTQLNNCVITSFRNALKSPWKGESIAFMHAVAFWFILVYIVYIGLERQMRLNPA